MKSVAPAAAFCGDSLDDSVLNIVRVLLIVTAVIVIMVLQKRKQRKEHQRALAQSLRQATAFRPPPAKQSAGPKPQNVILDLDIGSFKPLSDAEVKQGAV